MVQEGAVRETVGRILARRAPAVWSVPPTASVYDAIATMATHRVGTVLVMEDDALVGILTERDYARKIILQGRNSRGTLVREIMTSPVVFVGPDYTVDDCMTIMTRLQIRYLPVLADGRVLGVVSIGDLVKEIISAQDETIQHLEAYITGQYPR